MACTLSLITYLDRVCISRVKEDIAGELLLSDEQMGLVFSAFLLGYMIFEIPGGWLGDRWGSRRVLTRIVIWWSIFTALTGFVFHFRIYGPWPEAWASEAITVLIVFDSFGLLLLIRFLFGCGEAGAYPNLSRVVGSWFPYRERATAQGTIWMSARLGGAIAPVTIGALTFLFGWRWAFMTLGLVGVAWCIIFILYFRDRPEDHPHCNAAERELIRAGAHSWQAGQAHAGHGDVRWGVALRSTNLWALGLAAFGVSFGWYFYPTWQPQFLKDVHGISYEDSALLTGLPFLCGAAGCLIGGRLSDWLIRRTGSRRWGRSLLGIVGFSGAGLCVLGTPFVAEAWQAVTLLCLAFFINDIAIPVIWAVCTDISGRQAGSISGFMNTVGALGGMLSPALLPVLKNDLQEKMTLIASWQVIFMVLACAWFVAAAAWIRIDASQPLFPDDEGESSVT